MVVQLTGLSGAGKTTIADLSKIQLNEHKISAEILDADVYRTTLCRDLGFSREDRSENIRRLGILANELATEKDVIIIAAINPYEEIREELRIKYNAALVWINCSLEVLIKRDTKGLYKRAFLEDRNRDKLFNLSGINDIYEAPGSPDLVIHTDILSVNASVERLVQFLRS